MPATSDKRDLRKSQFAELKSFSLGDRKRAASKICGTLRCLPAVKSSGVIATYIALRSEPDLGQLLRQPPHGDGGGGFAVSRINAQGELDFHLLQSLEDLKPGKFGFLEPDPQSSPLIDLNEIDIVLTPGVGFDPATFQRLGRGKGHYDRFLQRLRAARANSEPPALVLGIAYHLQLVTVPAETHDQAMDGLVTEEGFWQTPTA